MRILSLIVLALGLVSILLSLPLFGFAGLGYLGVLADVSYAENRAMGAQLLYLGLAPSIGGMVLCVLGLLALPRKHRHSGTAPHIATDGGR
jgi:hypothetical protein